MGVSDLYHIDLLKWACAILGVFVEGRPKSVQQLRDSTVAARRAQSVTVPSSRVTSECRSPGFRSGVWGRGCDEAEVIEEKRLFTE